MKYGFVLTTYNDAEAAVEMFETLSKSIPPDADVELCIVDGGSTPKQLEKIASIQGWDVIHPKKCEHLSDALNAGIETILGQGCEYVYWIHTDMRFNTDFNWAEKLIWCYDYLWPLFGKLGPGTRNIDGSCPSQPLRGGNQCPVLFKRKVLEDLKEKFGYYYCPDYIKCFGREDWCNNQQLLQLGYGFGICSLTDVWHQGMGTRKNYNDVNMEATKNADVYYKMFGTWGEPGFEIDLTEIGKELRVEFEKVFKETWYNK